MLNILDAMGEMEQSLKTRRDISFRMPLLQIFNA